MVVKGHLLVKRWPSTFTDFSNLLASTGKLDGEEDLQSFFPKDSAIQRFALELDAALELCTAANISEVHPTKNSFIRRPITRGNRGRGGTEGARGRWRGESWEGPLSFHS